jgi:DNA-binding NtrC family response regulator
MADSDSKNRILVVDDSAPTLEILRRNLTSQGYQVRTAQSVDTAIDLLSAHELELVITDYKMPQSTGLDLIRHVRENHGNTAVMMITGFASVSNAVTAMKLGAVEYLAKPFTDEELFGRLAIST